MNDSILKQQWHIVGQPWLPSSQAPYVVAGHCDPHVGQFVCAADDLADDETEADSLSRAWAVIEHIVKLHNDSLINALGDGDE